MKYFYENRFTTFYNDIKVSIYENKNLNYLAHWHNDAELTYVKEGTLYVGVNNEKYSLNEGDMAIFNSGDIHHFETRELPSIAITLVFNTEFIGLSSNWPPKGRFSSPFIPKSVIENSDLIKIKKILNKILEEYKNKSDYYELFIKSGLNEICGLLLRNLDIEDSRHENNHSRVRIMQDVFSYIEDNYQSDISLQNIANHFNIDPYNLSKDFNILTGINLKTYINTLRIFKAEDMIINTNRDITDIALDSGFNCIRSFNRAFKQIKGYTPSSLRQH